MKCSALKELFLNGRHHLISLVLTAQYIIDLPVALRQNTDVFFLSAESSNNSREKIYREACGVIPDYKLFLKIFIACTEDYSTCVIDNKTRSSNVSDVVSHYKADINRKFKFGSPALWEFHTSKFESTVDKYKRNIKEKTELKTAPSARKGKDVDVEVVVVSSKKRKSMCRDGQK